MPGAMMKLLLGLAPGLYTPVATQISVHVGVPSAVCKSIGEDQLLPLFKLVPAVVTRQVFADAQQQMNNSSAVHCLKRAINESCTAFLPPKRQFAAVDATCASSTLPGLICLDLIVGLPELNDAQARLALA